MGESPVNPGDLLDGKYRVERLLGAGGMGVVVAARHRQLDERVAIKFLLEEALDSEVRVARFLREARAAARIHSEYAARVHDVGQLDSGLPYMVMEYLDGEDLDQRLKRDGPLPVADAAELLLQACEALAAAHGQGIVHRDVKPSNLFVAKRQDGSASIKVIDFGISKVPLEVESTRTDSDADSSSMTQSQTMIGSPHYMAPEQMRSAKHVDMRADIWGLGTTLHKMLTVKTPFKGNTVMAIFEDILNGYQGVLRHNEQLPATIDAVVRRCLCLAPDDRYANVAELAVALAPFAPPRALHLVERIEGTLRAAGMLGESQPSSQQSGTLPHGAGASGADRAATLADGSDDETLAHDKTVTVTEPAAEPPEHDWSAGAAGGDAVGLTTQEAWSELGGQRRSGSRLRLGLAAIAAAAMLIGGALWMGASAEDESAAAFAVEAASAMPGNAAPAASSADTGAATPEANTPPASSSSAEPKETAQPSDAAPSKGPAQPRSAQRTSPRPEPPAPAAPPAAPKTPPAKSAAPAGKKPELWGTPW